MLLFDLRTREKVSFKAHLAPLFAKWKIRWRKGVELKINFEKLGSKLYLFEKEKREEEAREHAARFATAVGAQSENKGIGFLEGPLSPSLTAIEDMSEKGAEIKINFEKFEYELQAETELTEVNPKRLNTVAVS